MFSFIDQIEPCRIKFVFIHLTRKEGFTYAILQIIFKQHTAFTSLNGLNPNPPSYFGLQTSLCYLCFFDFSSRPYHRKAEHSFSTSRIHSFGSWKIANKKFLMLANTELMSCSFPTNERKRVFQEPICARIFSKIGI